MDYDRIASVLYGKPLNQYWEDRFTAWAQGPSTTEQQKCENSEVAIRKALASYRKLNEMDISVFAQGSYKARTNIRQDSDVDICVRLNKVKGADIFFDSYPEGKTREDFGNSSSDFTFDEFKNLVGEALVAYFGQDQVRRGNKAFDIHANTYRIDADVVPAFEMRRYSNTANLLGKKFESGIKFFPDNGGEIHNWPEQNYGNGIEKNDATSRKYKRVIRIIKNLRNEMQEKKIPAANNIASFLIECLVWNTDNSVFISTTYYDTVRKCLAPLFNNTMKDDTCIDWGEVNELKYLFRTIQPWTRVQAHNFISAAWDYVGFK